MILYIAYFFIDLVSHPEYKCVSLTTFFVALDIKIYFIRIPLHSNKYLTKEKLVVLCLSPLVPVTIITNSLKWKMFVNSDSYNPLWTHRTMMARRIVRVAIIIFNKFVCERIHFIWYIYFTIPVLLGKIQRKSWRKFQFRSNKIFQIWIHT